MPGVWVTLGPGAAGAGGPPSGPAGGILDSTYPNPTSRTTASPQWAKLGLGTAPGTALLTTDTATAADRILEDIGEGSDWSAGTLPAGARYEIRHGSSGTPWSGSAPNFKIQSLYAYTTGVTNGADNHKYVVVDIMARGGPGNKAQTQAGSFFAQSLSTETQVFPTVNTDASAISGIGEVITGCKGRGIGGYFYGWIGVDADADARATGVEAAVRNLRIDHSVNETGTGGGSLSMGLWVPAFGNFRSAAGLQFGAESSASWQVGIFIGPRPGDTIITDSTLRDHSESTTSLDIRGTHTDALKIADGGGKIVFDPVGNSTDPATKNAIQFGSDANNARLQRSANDKLYTPDMFRAQDGLVTKQLGSLGGGSPAQGNFTALIENGLIVVEDTGGPTDKLWALVGGVWRSVALA